MNGQEDHLATPGPINLELYFTQGDSDMTPDHETIRNTLMGITIVQGIAFISILLTLRAISRRLRSLEQYRPAKPNQVHHHAPSDS